MIDQESALEYERVKAFGAMLETRRKALGVTQMQVGEATGLSQQFVSVSERLNPNSGIRAFELFRLLKYYGIKPNEAARVLGLL